MDIINQITENVNTDDLEIITDTGEVLSDIGRNGKEKEWNVHKQNNIRLATLIRKHNAEQHILTDKRLEDLEHCANTLMFANLDNGSKRLKTANFCRNRICPMCQWRRSLKTFSQVSKITTEIINKYDDVRFLFLTLTVKNCYADELTSTLDMLNAKFKYLTEKGKTFAPMKAFKEKCWLGCMKAIEVTYNSKDNTFHPHIHCILAVKKNYFNDSKLYISQSKWREIWKEALKISYLPMVNVKVIRINEKVFNRNAIAEMSKYPCKTLDIFKIKDEKLAISVLKTFTKVLYKRRFLSFSGIFKEIAKELRLKDVEDEKADLVHVDENREQYNIVSYTLYRYKSVAGCYIC